MLPLRDNVPTRTFPVVTVALIAVNAVVWFWELGGRGLDYHVVKDGFYPCSVQGPCERVGLNGHAVGHNLGGWRARSRRCSCTAAGSTSLGTCSFSGSSATTSRTHSAGCASCSGTWPRASRRWRRSRS